MIFKDRKPPPWPIFEKELIDEIIFKTTNPRNRIMLEFMARGGMRIGEILKIRPIDVQDRKITLPEPKSGKESEVVFIPQKVADRLKDYIKEKGIEPEQRIFPITYNAARVMVIKASKAVGIHLRPHDLRRFCATYASATVRQSRSCRRSSSAMPICHHSALPWKNQRYRSFEMD
jgi:integrase